MSRNVHLRPVIESIISVGLSSVNLQKLFYAYLYCKQLLDIENKFADGELN